MSGPVDTADEAAGIETRRLRGALSSKLFGASPTPLRLGRFEIRGSLGQGAMGTVYRAHDPTLDREVAVKVLRGGSAGTLDSEGAARLKREARALAQLNHPNVVEILDVGEHEGDVFIAMELVRGRSLDRWAEDQRVGAEARIEALLPLAIDATEGLQAAHAVGVVHRDVKPQNMLVSEGGRLLLADFGLAREGGDGASATDAGPTSGEETLSATGPAAAGTPAYMSPEQFTGHFDERSDQFSLCVSLWEVAFGQRPFAGETIYAVISGAVDGHIRMPAGMGQDAQWLAHVLRRGLHAKPQLRYPSMGALREALRTGPPSGRTGALVFGTLGLAAVGVVGIAALLERGGDDPCVAVADPMREIWTPRRAGTLELPADLEAAMDDYAKAWVVAREGVCESAQAEDADTARFDAIVVCLSRQLDDFRARVAVLAQGSSALAEASPPQALDDPATCADTTVNAPAFTLPEAPEQAEEVRALERVLREDVARGWARVEPASVEQATDWVEQARALGHEPTLLLALDRLGERQTVQGDPLAARTFGEAAEIASRLGLFRRAVRASTSAAAAHLRLGGRHEEAEQELRRAEALLHRVPHPKFHERAQLAFVDAERLVADGRSEQAVARLEAALENTADPLDEARLCTQLANALRELARYDEATIVGRRALTLFEFLGGEDQTPRSTVLTTLGRVAVERGDGPAAIEAFEEVLRITAQAVGQEHPLYAASLGNVGTARMLAGDRAGAAAAHRSAMKVFDAALPQAHPNRVSVRVNVATFVDSDEAEALLNEALALAEQHFGTEGVRAATVRSALGELYLRRGELARAAEAFERALALHQSLDRPRKVIVDQAGLSRALAGLGKMAEARAMADAAVGGAGRLLEPDAVGWLGPLLAVATAYRDDSTRASEALDRALALPNVEAWDPNGYAAAVALSRSLED